MAKRKAAKKDFAYMLYEAVARYVEANGGQVLIAGGIQVQQWPGKRKGVFSVAVECTGQMPQFAAKHEESNG